MASIGHTRATPEQIEAAVDAGATMSTHLGNGAHPVLPTKSSYIWSQLAEDRLTASFIVDGIHIPGPFLKTALRAKGLEHSVLITDAVMPAMCAPGPYNLGQVEVVLHEDGSVRLRDDNRLAGSALCMDRRHRNDGAIGRRLAARRHHHGHHQRGQSRPHQRAPARPQCRRPGRPGALSMESTMRKS